jgi:hypothetical protein
MIFWLYEAIGWALTILGLFLFYICLGLLVNPAPGLLEGAVLSVVGIVIYRGGVALLQACLAARVCRRSHVWLHDVFSWVLVGLGLFVFYLCLAMLLDPRPAFLQAGPLTLIGFIIYRGGIALMQTAMAARVSLQAVKSLEGDKGVSNVRRRPAQSVLSGRWR